MAKYIDAEKLKSIIKAQIKERKEWMKDIDRSDRQDQLWSDLNGEDMSILQIIDSLQQEQESVAERFARIVRGNLIGIDKEVQQKFESLYFEITGNKMYGGYND